LNRINLDYNTTWISKSQSKFEFYNFIY